MFILYIIRKILVSKALVFLKPEAKGPPERPRVKPLTHNQGPYDTSLAVIRHEKPLKVRLLNPPTRER